MSHFERYDPEVPWLVSVYGFYQLVAVVLLLNFMQGTELSYWGGFAMWAMMLGTTVTTALWLEGRAASGLIKWELLRLGAFGLLLATAWLGGSGNSASLAAAAIYSLLNLSFLPLLLRSSTANAATECHTQAV